MIGCVFSATSFSLNGFRVLTPPWERLRMFITSDYQINFILYSLSNMSSTPIRKGAKTLKKLAALNDERNRIHDSGGSSSLLSFINSIKR